MMRRVLSMIVAVLMFFAPRFAVASDSDVRVGVSLPMGCEKQGAAIESRLDGLGYAVLIEYAPDQASQAVSIGRMMEQNAEALIVAPADAASLTELIAGLKASHEIPVIAYGVPLDGADYYVGYDLYREGARQAAYIADALNLRGDVGPFYLEILCAPGGERMLEGAMSVLSPYIDRNVLIIKSGGVSFDQTQTSEALAQDRMLAILNELYGEEILDAVLAQNDALALSATNSLLANGYDPENFPIITGKGCALDNVRNIVAGVQSMSIFEDADWMAGEACKIADGLLTGKPDLTSYGTLDGVKAVLGEPCYVDIDNYLQILTESGIYLESELQ